MKKKIQPQDQVEKELMAAMESFNDEHLGTAEEGFPKGFRELAKAVNLKTEFNGSGYDKRLDKAGMNAFLKSFAQKLNLSLGIPCDKLDFDKYYLGETQLDSFPKGGVTFVEYSTPVTDGDWGPFFFYDGRTTVDRDKEGRFSQGRLYRERDQKVVRIHRIPVKQLLNYTKGIWFIPEDDLAALGNTDELRAKRSKSREGSIRRLTEKQLKKEYWRSSYDKSGYLIDEDALQRRLTRFKAKKQVGGLDQAVQTHQKNVEEFNQLTNEILDGASIIFHRAFEKQYSSYDKTLSEFLEKAKYLKSDLEKDTRKLEIFQKEVAEMGTISSKGDDYKWGRGNSGEFVDLMKRINSGLRTGYYYGKRYFEFYDILIQVIDEYGPTGNGEGVDE